MQLIRSRKIAEFLSAIKLSLKHSIVETKRLRGKDKKMKNCRDSSIIVKKGVIQMQLYFQIQVMQRQQRQSKRWWERIANCIKLHKCLNIREFETTASQISAFELNQIYNEEGVV